MGFKVLCHAIPRFAKGSIWVCWQKNVRFPFLIAITICFMRNESRIEQLPTLQPFLLPGISWQQTIFLSDLRFLVRWFHGSMVQSASAQLPRLFFLFSATRYFVLFSFEFKICAEVIVHRMFAVFLNSLNGKKTSRTIVRDIFSFFFNARFQDQLQRVFFVTQIVISGIRIVLKL